MHLPHLRDMLIHEVFAGDVEGVGEVVHLLVLGQGLVHGRLQGAAGPHQGPVLAVLGRNLSEPIVLHRVPDDLHLIIIELEVVPSIRRLVGPDAYVVFVGPENQKLLLYFETDLIRGHRLMVQLGVLRVLLGNLELCWVLHLDLLYLPFFKNNLRMAERVLVVLGVDFHLSLIHEGLQGSFIGA